MIAGVFVRELSPVLLYLAVDHMTIIIIISSLVDRLTSFDDNLAVDYTG